MLKTPKPTNKNYQPASNLEHFPDSLVDRVLIPHQKPVSFAPLSPYYMIRFGINAKQYANLVKLYHGLTNLYDNKHHIFDMSTWGEDRNEAINSTPDYPCGTPACALGFAPSCGIPVPKTLKFFNDFEKHKSWIKYSKQFTSKDYVRKFLFSADWADKINEQNGYDQMKEAIARIKYLLDGKLSKNFSFENSYT